MGGGLSCNRSTVVRNCTFAGNSACEGAAIDCGMALPILENCIIAFNEGYAFPLGIAVETPPNCCDIYGNDHGDWIGALAPFLGVGGNIALDPRFCGDSDDGDLTLADNSPCAPGNSSCGILIGALPVACEGTAVESMSWSRLKSLF
jgi:hypothetical protein